MSTDLYAGPLCRLFARDFESPAERMSKELGIPMQTIDPAGNPIERQHPKHFVPYFRGVMRELRGMLGAAEWDERPKAPLRCERLNAWTELRLLAAYADVDGLTMPNEPPADLATDAGLAFAQDLGVGAPGHHVHLCQWWLPGDFDVAVHGEFEGVGPRTIGSTPALLRTLKRLWTERTERDAIDEPALRAIADDASSSPLVRGAAETSLVVGALAQWAIEHRSMLVLYD